ncbi:nucleotidyltransferase domain-containing protein [Agrococcus sp. KRD186]|uniref:nucleotidyltransferase domain-containing protein n=1 Tax=Agrococcus sp. KRD186 TaxID=2729730 RepID=UPI0019D0C2A8|nr:nucleotidyltransferase domain-containing protein [Agrococcus sp. KRD186]
MQHLEIARRFVEQEFPGADSAVVAGSTASGRRTATSDIDLLVLGPEGMLGDADSLAANYAFEGEAMEVFAYTEAGFDRWANRGVEEARPVIVDMLVGGTAVLTGPTLLRLRPDWAAVLARGPVVDRRRLDLMRYAVTDLLDDLLDAHDALEQRTIMACLFEDVAALALLANGRWLGRGKHLVRRLRAWSPDRANALAAPLLAGDASAFGIAAGHELERAGGRLREGFVR